MFTSLADLESFAPSESFISSCWPFLSDFRLSCAFPMLPSDQFKQPKLPAACPQGWTFQQFSQWCRVSSCSITGGVANFVMLVAHTSKIPRRKNAEAEDMKMWSDFKSDDFFHAELSVNFSWDAEPGTRRQTHDLAKSVGANFDEENRLHQTIFWLRHCGFPFKSQDSLDIRILKLQKVICCYDLAPKLSNFDSGTHLTIARLLLLVVVDVIFPESTPVRVGCNLVVDWHGSVGFW